ncbi:Hypp479 [Branchiostoma lanceolatum]|uniref:Hypp479 protein n=1 Tax=Branchiostoma lanceolatum TaxID=7740 RepID=A0A8J9VMI0_BRALA|nr:Hypp479 [Branchiostoma lanceolatum]
MSQSMRRQLAREAEGRESADTSDTQAVPSQPPYAQIICEVSEKLGYTCEYTALTRILADPNDPRNEPLYTRARVTVIQAVALELQFFVNDLGGSSAPQKGLLWRVCNSLLPPGNKMPDSLEAAENMIEDLASDSVKSAQMTQ